MASILASDAPRLTIAILGTGAMGRYWAFRLRNLTPYMVGSVVAPYEVLDTNTGHRMVITPPYQGWDCAPEAPPDIVILAVKWRSLAIVANWIKRFAANSAVISTMNGMGQENILARSPSLALCLGTTTAAVSRQDLTGSLPQIHIKSHGTTQLPLVDDPRLEWFQHWTQKDDISWSWVLPDQMLSLRWQKLLQNSVINPLTALAGCSNGALTSVPLFRLNTALLAEGITVATHLGIHLPPNMSERVVQLTQATSDNRSSMLQDVIDRQATEIHAINGYIVQEAERLGLEAPTHAAIVSLVDALI